MKNNLYILILLACFPACIFAQQDTSRSRRPVFGVKAVAGLNMALPGQTLAPSAQGALFLDAGFKPTWSIGIELRKGVKTYSRRVDGNWSYSYSEQLYAIETPIVLKHTFYAGKQKHFTLGVGVGVGRGPVDMNVKKTNNADPYDVRIAGKQDGVLLSASYHYWMVIAHRDFALGKKWKCFAGLEYQQHSGSRQSHLFIIKPVGNSYEEIKATDITLQYRMLNVVMGFCF